MSRNAYAMENHGEAQRLETQALLPAYQIREELRNFHPSPRDRILDAGCGSGLLSRFLVEQFAGIQVDACDGSSTRLESARALAQSPRDQKIRFFESNLEKIEAGNASYDHVICRFVLEHNHDPVGILREFHRILKPGGSAWIIDLDGIIYNIYPQSPELQSDLVKLEKHYPGDLRIGRKIPSQMQEAGFDRLEWRAETLCFRDEELEAELELTRQRLEFARPITEKIFGSELNTRRFEKRYCKEMMKPGATLFYNKFVVIGRR